MHDEIGFALNDVEVQGGHPQSIQTLVFREELDPGGDSRDGMGSVKRKRCTTLPLRNARELVFQAVILDVGKVADRQQKPHEGRVVLKEG